MPFLRVVTDIEVKNEPGYDEMNTISERVREYAYGVITTLDLEGDESAYSQGAHMHYSSDEDVCGYCRTLSRDEIN